MAVRRPGPKTLDTGQCRLGLFLFVLGLAKKVLIADTFGVWATYGSDTATS